MTGERITLMMGEGRRQMNPLTYKRLRISSCLSRRHCSRVRMVGDSQAVAVQKGLGALAKHQVALVKRVQRVE